jgi:hypothetical protein
MEKELAVLVVHGIGSQAPRKGGVKPSDVQTFSKGLYNKVKKHIGAVDFSRIAWREAVWAGTVQKRQQRYLRKIKGKTRSDFVRGFFLNYLSDAASYQNLPTDINHNTYIDIHIIIARVVAELEQDVKAGAPLLIIAHSMGGHIVSNHIYDKHKLKPADGSAFTRMQNVAALVTFGCNIPLFVFAYDDESVLPIDDPGAELANKYHRKTWWHNYYDQDDVLGYPLAEISTGYGKLAKQGGLKETPVDSGRLFTSWNPFSHTKYWTDKEIYRPISALIQKQLGA